MSVSNIKGVIPAVPTPFSKTGEPDSHRLVDFCQLLLDKGVNALNINGTTGEATSMSCEQRKTVITTLGRSNIDKSRLMVGTGAAAVADAVTLSQIAAEVGFAGALILPPFYFKDPSQEGLLHYFLEIVTATQSSNLDLYLYNFPALSGVPFSIKLVETLSNAFGSRIKGLKDSSGNLEYASKVAKQFPQLKVFPSNEGTLLEARSGNFAGAISATANLSASYCISAYKTGDEMELEKAIAIRNIITKGPLVPRIKAVLADQLNDKEWANVLPPYHQLSSKETSALSLQIGL